MLGRGLSVLSILIGFLAIYFNTSATSINSMSGRVLDERKEPLVGAIAKLERENVVISIDTADIDGIFTLYYLSSMIKNTSLKIYYPSYTTLSFPAIQFRQSYVNTFQMKLAPGCSMAEIMPIVHRVPLTDSFGPVKRTFLSEEIEKMPR